MFGSFVSQKDAAGFIPALGAIPDAINGIWYMAEGDWENMGWSFVFAIPELGDALGLANKSRKVVKGLDLLDNVSDALELAKKAGKMETGAEMVKNFFKKGKKKLKEFWEKITRKNKKNCGSGRGTCFPSDTPILTREGYVPIQNIRAGDDIYSREETTGETGFQKVEEVFLRSVHTIYTIEVNTTAKIQTTSRHPFYVEKEGWVIANQLQVGMNLQTFNGTAVITNLKKERSDEEIPVYNFRVSGWSSYFVSEWNVYVHNAKKGEYKGNDKGITILKETDNFIDYVNSAGESIRIPKQTDKTILDSISKNLNSTDVGIQTEAKVANFISKNTKAQITDFGNKIKTVKGNTIGDIDVATKSELIEVKASISSVKEKQFAKYVNSSDKNYFNVSNKKVILYIDE